ncbi:hypothetical protein WN55_10630 [Dufourea novaeangliae]|uniref:Uncharacterized protein n=1 Tax=Dufourea novaeangliae TaxID=178035 RepID=A0A154P473_DUFNO|nr:hypothetical protein WN55_10630 [Dufourea novaeangliae]
MSLSPSEAQFSRCALSYHIAPQLGLPWALPGELLPPTFQPSQLVWARVTWRRLAAKHEGCRLISPDHLYRIHLNGPLFAGDKRSWKKQCMNSASRYQWKLVKGCGRRVGKARKFPDESFDRRCDSAGVLPSLGRLRRNAIIKSVADDITGNGRKSEQKEPRDEVGAARELAPRDYTVFDKILLRRKLEAQCRAVMHSHSYVKRSRNVIVNETKLESRKSDVYQNSKGPEGKDLWFAALLRQHPELTKLSHGTGEHGDCASISLGRQLRSC